jgi:hypothetical protein
MIFERLRWRYRDLFKWVFCLLFFRFYPILPESWRMWMFGTIVGPFYRILEPEVERIDRIIQQHNAGDSPICEECSHDRGEEVRHG